MKTYYTVIFSVRGLLQSVTLRLSIRHGDIYHKLLLHMFTQPLHS